MYFQPVVLFIDGTMTRFWFKNSLLSDGKDKSQEKPEEEADVSNEQESLNNL